MAYQLTDQNLMDKSTKDNEVARLRAALETIKALEPFRVHALYSNMGWQSGYNAALDYVQNVARAALENDNLPC
jgi:hypothetical protein